MPIVIRLLRLLINGIRYIMHVQGLEDRFFILQDIDIIEGLRRIETYKYTTIYLLHLLVHQL